MDSSRPLRIRKDDDEIAAYLDLLDNANKSNKHACARQSDRLRYRLTAIRVELSPRGGRPTQYLVPTRNISRDGLGFLLGHFVHPSTPCRLRLLSTRHDPQLVNGQVTRCRYIEGSGCVYEVGVKFDRPIEVARFSAEAQTSRVLLVDDDPAIPQLVEKLLAGINAEVTYAESGKRALELTDGASFDVAIVDMDMPEMNGFETVKQMRSAGYSGPIVALTALPDPEDRKRCFEAGCTRFLPKPVCRQALVALLTSLAGEPLVSSLAGEPDMVELIDHFVSELPARIAELKSATAASDVSAITQIVRSLKGQAGSYGFQVITELAAQIETLLRDSTDVEPVRKQLAALSQLCLAARPASGPAESGKAPEE